MTIGEKIRIARISRAMTQDEVGLKMGGVAGSTVRSYEVGRLNPKKETLRKIASAIGVEPNYFAEDDEKSYRSYTIWKNNWPIGSIDLYPWQAEQANAKNRDVYFSPEREDDE